LGQQHGTRGVQFGVGGGDGGFLFAAAAPFLFSPPLHRNSFFFCLFFNQISGNMEVLP
jgi:hypothetical protein